MFAMGGSSSASSSGEEDGDADWRSAIDSVAAVGYGVPAADGPTKANSDGGDWAPDDPQHEQQKAGTSVLKFYQIKAQKLLDDLLDKSFEIVTDSIPILDENYQANGGGIRLFRRAPPGMILEPNDQHPQQLKRPRILPGDDIDEKSKKFKLQLRSVAVDGADIIASARETSHRSLSRFEAKDAAAKAATKREEERVAELKSIRGERWLPSIAREMQRGTWAGGC